MLPTPAIVVPLYKRLTQLEDFERASLRQLLNVLRAHPIVFFHSPDLDVEEYLSYAVASGNTVRSELFAPHFFRDTATYSELMLSVDFYARFKEHTHILIYQLDAFIFRDELIKWCEAGFDYLGAPWVGDKSGRQASGPLVGVGNGGFSLRNIQAALNVLTSRRPFLRFKDIRSDYARFPLLFRASRVPIMAFRALTGWRNSGRYYASMFRRNEDSFWGEMLPRSRCPFALPSVEVAASFAFEVAPRQLFEMNGRTLPFGCHAFAKYDPDFWRSFIDW